MELRLVGLSLDDFPEQSDERRALKGELATEVSTLLQVAHGIVQVGRLTGSPFAFGVLLLSPPCGSFVV